jgi:hypothetical protein
MALEPPAERKVWLSLKGPVDMKLSKLAAYSSSENDGHAESAGLQAKRLQRNWELLTMPKIH